MSVDIFSFEYIHWGGSPKRVLHRSPGLSEEFVEKVKELDKYVRSVDTSFERFLKEGGLSWVLLPQNTRANVLVSSALVQQPGERPTWHFLALVIGKNNFLKFESIKQLLASITNELSSEWWERNFVIKETFDFVLLEDSEKLKLHDADNERVLETLCANDVSYLIDHAIAWNPSVKEKNWEYVISTGGWSVPCSQQQENPEEAKKKPPSNQRSSRRIQKKVKDVIDRVRRNQKRRPSTERTKNAKVTMGREPSEDGPSTERTQNAKDTMGRKPPSEGEPSSERIKKAKTEKRKRNDKLLPSLVLAAVFFVSCVLAAFNICSYTGEEEHDTYKSSIVDRVLAFIRVGSYSPEYLKEAIISKQGNEIVNTYNAEFITTLNDSWKVPFTDILIPGCSRKFIVSIQVSAEMCTDLCTIEIKNEHGRTVLSVPGSVVGNFERGGYEIKDKKVGLFRNPGLTQKEITGLYELPIELSKCTVNGIGLQQTANAYAVEKLKKITKTICDRPLEINAK